jgi:hypothetical protein
MTDMEHASSSSSVPAPGLPRAILTEFLGAPGAVAGSPPAASTAGPRSSSTLSKDYPGEKSASIDGAAFWAKAYGRELSPEELTEIRENLQALLGFLLENENIEGQA